MPDTHDTPGQLPWCSQAALSSRAAHQRVVGDPVDHKQQGCCHYDGPKPPPDGAQGGLEPALLQGLVLAQLPRKNDWHGCTVVQVVD